MKNRFADKFYTGLSLVFWPVTPEMYNNIIKLKLLSR